MLKLVGNILFTIAILSAMVFLSALIYETYTGFNSTARLIGVYGLTSMCITGMVGLYILITIDEL